MKPIIINYKPEYSLRDKIILFVLSKTILVHARFYSNREAWNLKKKDLIKFPEKSLGHELGLFLENEEIETIDKIERHDAFHIVLDYETNIVDETAMMFFLLGNGKYSPFTFGAAFFPGILYPEKWKHFYQHFKRGKDALPFTHWDFKALLNHNLEELKNIIFKKTNINAGI